MLNKTVLAAITLSLLAADALGRDPFPNKERLKHVIAPKSAEDADPATMLRPDGRRSDIMSFSCVFRGRQTVVHCLNDPAVDTLEKAKAICDRQYPGYTEIRKPYLKNNKNVRPDEERYDAHGYDWPIGPYLGKHTSYPGWMWATPLVYSQHDPPLEDPRCPGGTCDCIYHPAGPRETWIRITRKHEGRTLVCFAPPYTASGPWWDWLTAEFDKIRGRTDLAKVGAVGIFLGIDGEGRPLKSMENWVPDDPRVPERFYRQYAPAVVREIKRRYPGKTIRAHTDEPLKDFYLDNDVDIHRESLESDEIHAYLYRGLGTFGWWQCYADRFWLTNSQGLSPGWPPFYQCVLSALSKHTDMITGWVDLFDNGLYQDGRGDFIQFAGSYVGRDINDTPGGWIYLRETVHKKELSPGQNTSGKYGDYDFYLYRPEDLDGNHTVPVRTDELPSGTSRQIYNWRLPLVRHGYPTRNQYVGRKNAPGSRYMSFDVDDGYRFAGRAGSAYRFRIVYLDTGTEPFKLQYKNVQGQWREVPIARKNSRLWQEVRFTVKGAHFDNNASEGVNAKEYPTDFRIESAASPVTIHLIEVRGEGEVADGPRPKAQVSCDIVRSRTDDPREGIESVGLNQEILVKATLVDDHGQPLSGQRVTFAYNTEGNLAKSTATDKSGVAFCTIRTANRPDSSGFLGAVPGRPDKVSSYSVQAFYPGSRRYQPSRNDCTLLVTGSTGPGDRWNTRLRIAKIDAAQAPATGKVIVSYQVLNRAGAVIADGSRAIGKSGGYYVDDPSQQTVPITWIGRGVPYHPCFNNVTLTGIGCHAHACRGHVSASHGDASVAMAPIHTFCGSSRALAP